MVCDSINNKLTLTIGIPAYNESGNIDFLLRSIFKQRMENFILEKVIVVCDGCSDDTEQKVLNFAKVSSVVQAVNDGINKGKINRLNELYQMNQSDFLLTLDGDVVLAGGSDIEEMVKLFADKNVLVVGAHEEPVKPDKGFVAKILYTSYILWDEVRVSINGGDHIVNLYGSATMLRKSFAKSVIYPPLITADEEYLYVAAKRKNGFKYAKNTRIFYRPAENFEEWRWQSARFLKERHALKKYYGESVIRLHEIPVKYKIKAIIKMLLKSPVYTIMALMLNMYSRLFPLRDLLNEKGSWRIASTTKKGIDMRVAKKEKTINNLLSNDLYFFSGKFFDYLERIFFRNSSRLLGYPAGYRSIKQYDLFTGQDFSRSIGLFENNEGRKVIIKELFYRFHNLKYHQIMNELTVLNLLAVVQSRTSGVIIKFPRILDWEDNGRKLSEVREYVAGEPLKGFDKEYTAGAIKQCLETLKKLSGSIRQAEEKNLPKRSPRFLRWIFPLYFIQAALRDPKKIKQYFYFLILFYKLDLSAASSGKLVLAHRDMHSQNIIIKNGIGAIIDFEISALAEPETDLAIAARYFAGELGVDRVKKLIYDLASDDASRRNFLRLTIFYAIQSLAIEFKAIEFYKDSQDYLTMLEQEIIPDVIKEKNMIIHKASE